MRGNAKIQKALYDLWFKHYTTADNNTRVELVEEFIDEHLEGNTPANLEHIRYKHPANHQRGIKDKLRLYNIGEILSDFIIRAEEDETELTTSRQTVMNRKQRRKEREVYVDFTDTFDDDMQAVIRKGGAITEYDLLGKNPLLYPDFTDEEVLNLTATEFKKLIEKVRLDAERYAGIYSEKYKKDYGETLKRIRRLDVRRVDICDECGEVYYKHDLRRRYCDLRPSCERNVKKRRDKERYLIEKSRKVKDEAEELHKVVRGA